MTPTFKALTPAGEWVEGWYFCNGSEHGIINSKFFTGSWVAVLPETVCMATPIKDRHKNTVFIGDEIIDGMSNIKYIVKYGFCKKYAFTGVYVESLEGREATINNDSGEDHNHFITLTGKNIHDKTARK